MEWLDSQRNDSRKGVRHAGQTNFVSATIRRMHSRRNLPSTPLTKIATEVSPEIQRFIDENINLIQDTYFFCSQPLVQEKYGAPTSMETSFIGTISSAPTRRSKRLPVYVHHKNKDPKKRAEGAFTHYNPACTAELIVQLDRSKAPNIAADADNGKLWDVSMGCKVKFDVCSICGTKHTPGRSIVRI